MLVICSKIKTGFHITSVKNLSLMKIQKRKLLLKFSIFISLLFISNLTFSQCAISCTDVQVTLDENCESEILPDMISEGPDPICISNYIVEIYDLDGNLIPTSPIINADYVNQTLIGHLIDTTNGNFCTDSIFVEDKLDPILICPIDTGIYIMETPDTMLTGSAIGIDGCGIVTLTYSDITAPFGNAGSDTLEVITRTWTATDPSGNSSTCDQLIFLIHPMMSLVAFPDHLDDVMSPALNCGSEDTSPANCGEPKINGYAVNGIYGYSSSYLDNPVNLCDGSYALYREWKVINLLAAQDVEYNQVIIVDDENPPSLTCPSDMTISTNGNNCSATLIIPNPVISDLCASTDSIVVVLQVTSGQVSGNTIYDMDFGVHQATCVATDACGNQSTCNFTITVEDQQPPVAITNSSPNVTLVPVGPTFVNAGTFDDGSWDNCGEITLSARRVDLPSCDTIGNTFAPTVPFFCCDIGSPVMVELRVEDAAGNQSFAMSQASIFDNTNPGILCPDDITIACTDDYMDLNLTGNIIASDNCEGYIIDFTDSVDINVCGEGIVMRTWIIEDAGGLLANCTQNIYLENPNVFYINPTDPLDPNDDIIWPMDYTSFTCDGIYNPDSLPAGYDFPQIISDTCGDIGISFNDTDITIINGACRKILRTWIIIDFCQFNPLTFEGKWEYGQIIEILNSDAPQFIDDCIDLTFCSFQATCTTENITLEIDATDDCTPASELIYNYEIDLNKDGINEISGIGKSVTDDLPYGIHTVTFYVEDGCGQSNSCTYDFEILDCQPTSPVCYLSLGVQLNGGGVTIQAESLNEGSSDNCTPTSNLIYSFSTDTSHTDTIFDCANVGFNSVELWVTDENGNQAFCNAFIEIQDNQNTCPQVTASVVGVIQNENGENIEEVEINLNSNNNPLPPFITGPNGAFSFTALTTGEDYEVEPQKTINPLNGVTTYDLVLIQKHILGTELLDSPYKVIAADANLSKSITALDIVEIRKIILHIEDDFNDGNSWRFIDKDFVFASTINPFFPEFPEAISIDNLGANMDLDFVAIKKGDVNGTASPNNLINVDDRERVDNLSLFIDNQSFTSGEKITIDFHAYNFENINGVQLSLNFNQNLFDFGKIIPAALPDLDENNFGLQQTDKGILTMSWNGNQALNFDANAILFSIEMTPKVNGNTSQIFQVSSFPTLAEAYNNETPWGVELNVLKKTNPAFSVGQNIPNPFSETTTIPFSIPVFGEVTLSIFSLDGKMVYQYNNTFTKGNHQVNVDKKALGENGVFYYQVKSKFGTAVRKMIMIK